MNEIGLLAECRICGRKTLIRELVNGVTHTMSRVIQCWDCMTPDYREEMRKEFKLPIPPPPPSHVCGLTGFDPWKGDTCPGCEHYRETRQGSPG